MLSQKQYQLIGKVSRYCLLHIIYIRETGDNWDTFIIYRPGADDYRFIGIQTNIQPRSDICYYNKGLKKMTTKTCRDLENF